MKLRSFPEALQRTDALDGPAATLRDVITKLTEPGVVKDALSGTWLGHPLHPMLTDLPIGFWSNAFIFDLLPTKSARRAADTMVALGIAAAIPAALTGASDFGDTDEEERRVGIVHAAANITATLLYTASLYARLRGRRTRGVALGMAGATAATVGGYLGGHLVSALGVGVDNTAFEDGPDEWTVVLDETELDEDKPVLAMAGKVGVVLVRRDDRVLALSDTCTHRGGPLHEGRVEGNCIECPWHASRFALSDGEIVRGPATLPQPRYEARISAAGKVEIRKPRIG
jgi:nitrite reductase/ring-hydroxylating ferredoxin subunit/uncharacterized membrane protein